MTLVRPDDLTPIRDARLLGLYRYWHGELAGRALPARCDIDRIEMKRWLGNLILVEFPPDPMADRIRLDGVNIVQFCGASRAGQEIEALTSEQERRILLPQYLSVPEQKRPAYFESEFETSERVPTFQRKLLLPLSDDGERVNMILGGIYFDRARG